MARRFSFQAPDELSRAIRAFAAEQGLSVGEAIRTLVRAGFGVPASERGYREGVARGSAAFRKALGQALKKAES